MRPLALIVAMLVATPALAQPARPEVSSRDQMPDKTAVLRALDESYPDRPEWVDMFADILQGSQLGPGEGWFRRAVAQTRFGWPEVKKTYDRDGDGKISPDEFGGALTDFERLDRDRDKSLSAPDFDFSPNALAPSMGSMLFGRFDRDSDGKVSEEEIRTYFDAMDRGKQGFLSLSDFQEGFATPPARPADAKAAAPTGPSRETLIRGLFRQEIGSLQPGPALGESAPDFTLKTVDGREEITLSKLIGPKPVVLVFGNFTCGPFRNQGGNVEKLFRNYKDRATFVMVYVREAHPIDGWRMESNDRAEVVLPQPTTYEERVAVAEKCSERLKLGFPMLVDTIDDAVGATYSGMPSRLYLIDSKGTVAAKSGRGPFGFKPAELEHSLLLLLREGQAPAAAAEADGR